MDLLLILGRGMNRKGGIWTPTEDIEMCSEHGAHLLDHVPPDDSNPNCLVGGSELNLLAGVEVHKKYTPKIVVIAFGHRSQYLEEAGAPSESDIMSAKFAEILPRASVVVWNKKTPSCRPSNTFVELVNAFKVAVEHGGPYTHMGIVTVGVHIARTAHFVCRHQQTPKFSHLKIRFFESEEVLLDADLIKYRERVAALRNSQAFLRTLSREANGIRDLLLGKYKAVSSY